MRQTATEYLSAVDVRDMDKLDALLHPQFRIVVERRDEELQLLSKAEFLWLILAEELGGDARSVDEVSVEVSGNRALAYVRYEGHLAKFDAMQTLIRDGGRWKLIHALVWYDPKSSPTGAPRAKWGNVLDHQTGSLPPPSQVPESSSNKR